MKKLFWLLVLLPLFTHAQKEISLYGLKHVPQIVYFNPALAPNGRINIGMPALSSINLSVGRSDFLVSQLVTTNDKGEQAFNVQKFVNGLKDKNELFGQISLDAIHIGFGSGRNYFHLNLTDRFDINVEFPKEAATFIREVYNQNYLNQNVDVRGIKVRLQHYRELGFGMSRDINEKLRVGGKIKLLSGIGNIQTQQLDFMLDTDLSSDSIVGGRVNFDLQTSGIDGYTGGNTASHIAGFGKNMGFAFDLGANYKFNNKFEVSFALLDIMSSINWNSQVRNFKNDGIKVEFSPLGGLSVFENNKAGDGIGNIVDSLKTVMEKSENSNAYKTTVPTKVNFVASFNPTPKTQLSLISHNILYENNPRNYLKLLFNGRLNKVLNGTISYALVDEHETPLNLGVGFALNIGFFQIHALTENVLVALVSAEQSKNPNIRFGINFTFARDNQ